MSDFLITIKNMKKTHNWSTMIFLVICLGGLISCNSDDVELVDASYKTLEISCGGAFEIPVLAIDWDIECVKDATSGQEISDKDGNLLALYGNGYIESSNGWLTLSRESKETFIVSLKENFDKSLERKFLICINSAGKRDYVTVVQQAGTEYKLVKSEYEEIEDQRNIYVSDKECTSIVLSNFSSTEIWEPTGEVYKNVVTTSIFESDNYGAFDWMSEKGIEVIVPDLIIDGTIRGGSSPTYYKEGITTVSYIKDIPNGNKILMKPYSTLYLSGEITYCKRVCNYTFIVENMETGTLFEVKGVWTQIVPISSHTIASDKRP